VLGRRAQCSARARKAECRQRREAFAEPGLPGRERKAARGVRILVAVKRVPITGGKMVLTDDEQSIQTRHLGFTISPHEECGVEEAVRIVEAQGGEVVVLTLGPAEAEEQLRECMALGADRAIHLVTEEEWDAQATASALVEAIRAEEPFDLIVFGNESADAGNYQVGIRIAYALGLPVVTGLKGLTVADGRARCEQEVATGRDVYDVALPAVVTVKEGLNLPRYPSVPAKLRANRKPVDAKPVERPASRLEKLRLVVPEGQGKQAEILGHGADAAPAVVEVLQKLGIA
jgi:electron transfer flavoprotein beta subunit